MSAYYEDGHVTVHAGDCLEVMAALPDSSVDAVVTDPPYGLEFMGKDWDRPWAVTATASVGFDGRENNLTLPTHRDGRNANCRACGGRQRGAKRCQCAQPDWDRDPSSDMREFQQWCELWAVECLRLLKPGGHLLAFGGTRTHHRLACAIEDAGFEIRDSIAWLYGSGFPKSLNLSGGLGTALKPAHEPIVMARKPIRGTVAANVVEHGTGALNIDACRVEMSDDDADFIRKTARPNSAGQEHVGAVMNRPPNPTVNVHAAGRWPANVVIDDTTAAEIDKQTGVSQSRIGKPRGADAGNGWGMTATGAEYDDIGGASRFFPTFRYEPKAPTTERPSVNGIAHPTVKPLDLMRWLVRLVTPPDGIVLDPFAGSGTTAEACIHEHKRAVVIEREPDYLPLILARLSKPMAIGFNFGEPA